jgi:hypothetical protein
LLSLGEGVRVHKEPDRDGVCYVFDDDGRTGLCVSHRNGQPRLVVNFVILYGCVEICTTLPRIDFSLVDLGEIDILVSRQWWEQHRTVEPSPCSEILRPHDYLVLQQPVLAWWQGIRAHALVPSADLRWPKNGEKHLGRRDAPHLRTGATKIYLWDGPGTVCAVNPRWLTTNRRHFREQPKLIDHEGATCFFPGVLADL